MSSSNNRPGGGKRPNSPRYSDRYGKGHVNPYLGGQFRHDTLLKEIEESQNAVREENELEMRRAEERAAAAAESAAAMPRESVHGNGNHSHTAHRTARKRVRENIDQPRAVNDPQMQERLRQIQEQAMIEARAFREDRQPDGAGFDDGDTTPDVKLKLSEDNKPLIALESRGSDGRLEVKWIPVVLSEEEMEAFFPAIEPAQDSRGIMLEENKELNLNEESGGIPDEDGLVLIPIAGMEEESSGADAAVPVIAAAAVELLDSAADSNESDIPADDTPSAGDSAIDSLPVITLEEADETVTQSDDAGEQTGEPVVPVIPVVTGRDDDSDDQPEETQDEPEAEPEDEPQESGEPTSTQDDEGTPETPEEPDTPDAEDEPDEAALPEDSSGNDDSSGEDVPEEDAKAAVVIAPESDDQDAGEPEEQPESHEQPEEAQDEPEAEPDGEAQQTGGEQTEPEESAEKPVQPGGEEEFPLPVDDQQAGPDGETASGTDEPQPDKQPGRRTERPKHKRRRSRPTDVACPVELTPAVQQTEQSEEGQPAEEAATEEILPVEEEAPVKRRTAVASRPVYDDLNASSRYSQSRYQESDGQDDSLFIRRDRPGNTALFVLPDGVKLPKYIDDDDFVERWLGNEEEEDMASESKRRRRRISTLIGAVTMVLALVGFIAIARWGIGLLSGIGNTDSQKTEYADFISPIVMSEVPVFETWDAIPQDKLLQSAVFSVLLEMDVSYERDDTGKFIIPSTDIVDEVKELYGAYSEDPVQDDEINTQIRNALYGSAGEDTTNTDVYYVDMEDSFHVADGLSGPAPQVTDISRRDNTVTLVVQYLEDLEGGSGGILYARQYILYLDGDGYYVQAVREYEE